MSDSEEYTAKTRSWANLIVQNPEVSMPPQNGCRHPTYVTGGVKGADGVVRNTNVCMTCEVQWPALEPKR